MNLEVFKRATSKSETKKIRREGDIPAVIYVKNKATETVVVKGSEFSSLLRKLQPGRLSTTVFTLKDEQGKTHRVIVKEIQYEPTTYAVRHLDFEGLVDDQKINVKVPVECTGIVDCAGIKLGGVLRQVIRFLRVRCLPKDIPTVFQIDIRNLAQFESKRLSDLEIPPTVRPLADLNEVAVVIAKR